jgi:hypothetical protein
VRATQVGKALRISVWGLATIAASRGGLAQTNDAPMQYSSQSSGSAQGPAGGSCDLDEGVGEAEIGPSRTRARGDFGKRKDHLLGSVVLASKIQPN